MSCDISQHNILATCPQWLLCNLNGSPQLWFNDANIATTDTNATTVTTATTDITATAAITATTTNTTTTASTAIELYRR